ncbi:MBL fold metallo-hydrolase [Deinococcus deserti]|uniref:Putative Zn-dependent hydrolases of the beta-lactamase fold protein n=1 Tax=Deinococcus deserti (strain DSM 17065 / CIP 109153 / LMG 22923 / VCD115) TaxID=546414 RepID=C1D3Z0_DEIDV|nr:MBL fold metallo-hydrolase [Deinococcus deserti]ACO48219.1 putative Zn-dependent hydrolases of the beta-lactamase fold protein [Deinococcus deserti VCD115]
MRLQLIRNATLRLAYAGTTLLVDPFLADQFSLPSIAGKSQNPTAALPVSAEHVVQNVVLVLVSHLHPDHIDLTPPRIPTQLPLLSQPTDADALRAAGFTDVTGISNEFHWKGICITRTGGAHGTGPVGAALGEVSGFVLQAPGEPTVYIAGDTIWNDDVRAAIQAFGPEVIITNSGGALIRDTLIIMDTEQTLAVAAAAPQATVIAVHLEAYDHAPVTRDQLRAAASEAGITERVLVPEDGETIEIYVQ